MFLCREVEEARRLADPDRAALKADLRAGLDSLISGAKARSVKGSRRPSLADSLPPPSAEIQKQLRFNLPDSCRQKEESVTGVSDLTSPVQITFYI